jgi:hypothetical protein
LAYQVGNSNILTLAEWQPSADNVITSLIIYSNFLNVSGQSFSAQNYNFAAPPGTGTLHSAEKFATPFWLGSSQISLANAGCRPRGNRQRFASVGASTWYINWYVNCSSLV